MGSTGAARGMASAPTSTTSEERVKYQKFRGNPESSGGWSFTGNKFTEDWFKEHSSAYDQIEAMDSEERAAFHAWTRGDFMDGAQYRGWEAMDSYQREQTRIFDRILDRSVLKEGIITYRRGTFELINNGSRSSLSLEQINAMKGQIITSKGSMSTAAASSGLWGMGGSKPVEYEFKIPPGTGAGMWVGDTRINGWGSEQREFMTNRDSTWRVDGARYDSNKGVNVVTLTYMGHEKHSYK